MLTDEEINSFVGDYYISDDKLVVIPSQTVMGISREEFEVVTCDKDLIELFKRYFHYEVGYRLADCTISVSYDSEFEGTTFEGFDITYTPHPLKDKVREALRCLIG